jgi:4-amino-4-deoxy-L-arabinose transferase-like glycosyltransferase
MARRERGTRFLLAWLVPAWIVFELVVTKLPHYVLPLYPAIAVLIAGTIERGVLSQNHWLERGTLLWLLIPVLLTGAAIAALVVLDGKLGLAAWPFTAAAVAFGLLAWWFYPADGAERSLLRALAASLMIAVSVYVITLPGLTRLFPSVALAKALHAADCRHPAVAAAGYHEPSFVFLAGSSTLLTNGAGAANFLAEGGCRVVLVETRSASEFVDRARDIGLRYSATTTVEGLNYSNGRQVKVTAYRAEPAQ